MSALLDDELDGIEGWEAVGRVGLGGPTCFRGRVVPAIELDGPAIGGPVRGCLFATPFFFLGMNNPTSDMVSLYMYGRVECSE